MNVRDVCFSFLKFNEDYFRLIEAAVPPAQWIPWEDTFNWRYQEKLPAQILVQKMARQITGLKAVDVLILRGLLQEVGVMFRILDEIEEDVAFMALALANDKWSKHHTAYSEYFWSENEADRQPPVQRKTIRAFINRVFDIPDPSSADAAGRAIHGAFSNYVHARSAPTMGMVHGPPAKFELNGIADDFAKQPYIEQMPAYFYRAAAAVAMSAKVTLDDAINSECYRDLKDLEYQHSMHLFTKGHRD